MTTYLLDTNHLSPLVTLDHPLRQILIERLESSDTFAISTLALTEFLFGIQMLPRVAANMKEWQKYQDAFVYYDIDRNDAILASSLQITLRRRGRQLHTVDALIAATALRHKLTLLTADKDFNVVPELEIENWILNS